MMDMANYSIYLTGNGADLYCNGLLLGDFPSEQAAHIWIRSWAAGRDRIERLDYTVDVIR